VWRHRRSEANWISSDSPSTGRPRPVVAATRTQSLRSSGEAVGLESWRLLRVHPGYISPASAIFLDLLGFDHVFGPWSLGCLSAAVQIGLQAIHAGFNQSEKRDRFFRGFYI